ncbi:uncharacterized protein LOC126845143 [Adelges cooleyi]|uniref:uncharacterized protein LOC126845143 n=1 Tax=Adelges cooleyi TaxID=133065 RepID=UPI00217F4AC5|nr:uncharacterized protein LOC126845143 [Adelges cooleyi]
MYFKYANIFVYLFVYFQIANTFTDKQLEKIHSEVKILSAKANCPFGCFGCFGTVNKIDTRSYLNKHLSEYGLTMESMRAITEGLPKVDGHIKKKAFIDHMKQKYNEYYGIVNDVVPSTGEK